MYVKIFANKARLDTGDSQKHDKCECVWVSWTPRTQSLFLQGGLSPLAPLEIMTDWSEQKMFDETQNS